MNRPAFGCLAAAVLIATASTALPASAAEQARSAPAPHRIQVFLTEGEWEQMLADGRRQEAEAQAGRPDTAAPRVQQQARTDRAAPTRRASTPVAAEQAARRVAATPEAIDVSATTTRDPGVLAAAPPLGTVPPEPQLGECFSGGANDAFGRILNRFAYCQEQSLIAEYIVRIDNFPDFKLGETEFRYETFAQGDELDRRIRVFARVQADSVQYRWRTSFYNLFVAPNVPLTVVAECAESFLTCQATRAPVTLPFVAWNGNDDFWPYWDVLSPSSAGTGRDLIAHAHWYLEFETRFGRASADFDTDPRQIRCDSATYFNRGQVNYPYACVFNEAIPHLNYSKAPGSSVQEVAEHIEKAQTRPNDTFPLLVPPGFPPPPEGKRIPGRYVPGDPDAPGLHRIREEADPAQYLANFQHKEAACYRRGPLVDEYEDLWLTNPPLPTEQCDEYPFATTLEGAGNPEWDFSVEAVLQSHNSTAGQQLGAFLTDDRILSYDATIPLAANDRFYVHIT